MLWEILKAGRTNNSEDLFTRLAAEGISGAMNTSTVSGISPLVMPNCSGKPLISCIITGNTVQNGTPTTGTPVDVQGVGDYDAETGLYKIPVVSSADGAEPITTQIYLPTPLYDDEVLRSNGSRDVKLAKLVLTGDEEYELQSINSYGIANFSINNNGMRQDKPLLCTHFCNQRTLISDTKTEGIFNSVGSILYIRISEETAKTVGEFKEFITEQYSAGTPVTVWYHLVDPTTETVTVPRIQTIRSSAATLSIGTHVQPENVTVKYRR